jgi:amidase
MTPPPRLRIGWYSAPVIGETPPTDEVVTAMADTVELLTELGHEVVEMPPPMDRRSVAVFEVLWWALADSVPLPPEIEAQLTPLTRWQREGSRQHGAGQLAAAVLEARRLARMAAQAMADYDVVLSPTAAAPAFAVGSMRDDDDPAADFHAQKQWSTYTAVYNLTGQPAINVPLNWTESGIPVGVQFAAAWGQEAVLVSLAAELEGERPWRHRHPSMW